jgi:4-amino-4-deoxy-L-arabinose transferase-like glycosyltransferase
VLVLGMNFIIKNLDYVADGNDAHQLRIAHDGDLGDMAFAHLAHDIADIVIEVAGHRVPGHELGDAQATEALATAMNHSQYVAFTEHPDQVTSVVDHGQRADVVLHKLGDRFAHGRIGIDRDDAAALVLDDIADKHGAPPRHGACERSQRLKSLPTDALDLRKGCVTSVHRDIILPAMQIIFLTVVYFGKRTVMTQRSCRNQRRNSRGARRQTDPVGTCLIGDCTSKDRRTAAIGLSFPPLVKGGAGGVGEQDSDCTNGFPSRTLSCPEAGHASSRETLASPASNGPGPTPPTPPFTRGGKNTTRGPRLRRDAEALGRTVVVGSGPAPPIPLFRKGDETARIVPRHLSAWDSLWPLVMLLLTTFLLRAFYADQPIVENYVGRQVPTAMVARNLDRGMGLLHPQLDTAPFPNYFLVEPPIYESGVVILKRATGLSLEEAGRIFSAMATTLAALGLFMLARPREGPRAAYLAVTAFAVFPLTIRYGRAFQPDAAMMGAVVLGLACWDRYHRRHGRYWLAAAWILVALGFALKITAAFLLVPLVLVIARARTPRAILLVCSTLLPAFLWYAWVLHLLGSGEGSHASADNRSIWLALLGPSALLKPETLKLVGWFLFVRAFTPLGAVLAMIGLAGAGWRARQERNDRAQDNRSENGDALWLIWGISAIVAMAFLAQKLHHEYYWLLVAPVAAVGIGRCLAWLAQSRRSMTAAVTVLLFLLAWLQVRSTWRTPDEWNGLEQAASAVRATVPVEALVVAPEALLFSADRRGCRMEWSDSAAARAAGEWDPRQRVNGPLELVEYYRRQGARFFADLGCRDTDLARKGLHDAVRQRYKVIVDRPDAIIAELADSETHWNAN